MFLARLLHFWLDQSIQDYAYLPMVDCFAGQLNQVWMNLLRQAAGRRGNRRRCLYFEFALTVKVIG